MKLTENQKREIEKFITSKWTESDKCQICGTNDWSYINNIYKYTEFGSPKTAAGRVSIPVFLIICKNCGNLLSFSAVRMGILERGKKKRTKPEGHKE